MLVAGLGTGVYALIEGPGNGWSTRVIMLGLVGVVALVAFVVIERRVPNPMVPLALFRVRGSSRARTPSRCFSTPRSQECSSSWWCTSRPTWAIPRWRPVRRSCPVTVCSLLLSPRAGALSQRIGPRLPDDHRPLIAGSGIALLTLRRTRPLLLGRRAPRSDRARFRPQHRRWRRSRPRCSPRRVMQHAGIGSAINNAVLASPGSWRSRSCPTAAGTDDERTSLDLVDGFGTAMVICGVTCALGGSSPPR